MLLAVLHCRTSCRFMTLYANRCEPEVTLKFWDLLLLELDDDPLLHYFASLSLLISRRDAILKEVLARGQGAAWNFSPLLF